MYHSPPGCDQCIPGWFKKSYNHPCVDCQSVFGEACLLCNDFHGCGQCIDDFKLSYSADKLLWYCEPTPCLNPDNNCRVCNNGLCSQCRSGTLDDDQKSCS